VKKISQQQHAMVIILQAYSSDCPVVIYKIYTNECGSRIQGIC